MKILPVSDPSFQNYGQVMTGYDLKELLETLDKVTPCPDGVEYVPEQPELQALAIEKDLRNNAYGGMPIQIGWCNGHNTKMNCLEYHRDQRFFQSWFQIKLVKVCPGFQLKFLHKLGSGIRHIIFHDIQQALDAFGKISVLFRHLLNCPVKRQVDLVQHELNKHI